MTSALTPRTSPGFMLWRVTLAWQRLMTATLKPYGLTHVQFVLLASTWWLIERAGETPNQRRVSQHANTDPMMTSQVLRALETKGLVTRVADTHDSRARRPAVTANGAELARNAVTAVNAADKRFFGSAADTRAALEMLHRLEGRAG